MPVPPVTSVTRYKSPCITWAGEGSTAPAASSAQATTRARGESVAWGVAEAEGGWEAAMFEEWVTLLPNLLRLCPPPPTEAFVLAPSTTGPGCWCDNPVRLVLTVLWGYLETRGSTVLPAGCHGASGESTLLSRGKAPVPAAPLPPRPGQSRAGSCLSAGLSPLQRSSAGPGALPSTAHPALLARAPQRCSRGSPRVSAGELG